MDLIDRQALLKQIDIDSDGEPGYYGDTWKFIDTIKSMPSATDKNVGTKLGTDLAEVGTDCISRQSAIDAFNTNLNELVVGGEENAKTVENYLNRVLDKIKCLPSAQPKKGRWISADAMFHGVPFYCSECGENTWDTVMGKPRWKFLPDVWGEDGRSR